MEFLAEGSKDCPLIRLSAFHQPAVLHLRDLINGLATGTVTGDSLHTKPWIEPINGCELEVSLGKCDQGIMQSGSSRFECVLSHEGWLDVAFLLEPFCVKGDPSGFQWLNRRGKISFLISSTGTW